jgi:dihydroorotate dehydrogenase (fumarate)
MRWIAILHGRLKASLAATTGVHSGQDAAKMILAGADAVMMCSALLLRGIAHLRTVRDGLEEVLEAGGYTSVAEARGVLSQKNCPEPSAFERANYMKALTTFGQTATLE